MELFISGLESAANRSTGLGTARSLRIAYPRATLVGVDYSAASSRLPWPTFDSLWQPGCWADLHLDDYARQISNLLAAGAVWIPGVERELAWLSEAVEPSPRMLVPSRTALAALATPLESVSRRLGLALSPTVSADSPQSELHAFCRFHDWRIWLKGPFQGESLPVRSWAGLTAARRRASLVWGPQEVFLQAHVEGTAESVALDAYEGELVGACHLVKRAPAHEDTPWMGSIADVPTEMVAPLRALVSDVSWNGGAEIQMVRDSSGTIWIVGFEPRFPAWIHGATLAGWNLPARLVAAATGDAIPCPPSHGQHFMRLVVEVVVSGSRDRFRRPDSGRAWNESAEADLPTTLSDQDSGSGLTMNTPSIDRGTSIAGTVSAGLKRPSVVTPWRNPQMLGRDLDQHLTPEITTPASVFLSAGTAEYWKSVSEAIEALPPGNIGVKIAYSIKTNPHEEALSLASSCGFLAEAISQLEVDRALAAGLSAGEIVLNGPGKWWPDRPPGRRFRAVFCDSLVELRRIRQWLEAGDRVADVVGIRIRPPQFSSRFGIPVVPSQAFAEVVDEVTKMPPQVRFGVHFHLPPSMIGVKRWWHLVAAMYGWAEEIQTAAQTPVRCFDLGGGWHPDDWVRHLLPRLPELVERATSTLPHLSEIVLEPGRALVQPAMAVIARVLEVRPLFGEITEVVIDAAIAELPESAAYPHPILHKDQESGFWEVLPPGPSRVLGRSCMEEDVLATDVALPPALHAGDLLAIADAGAYDKSKSYTFGRG